MMNAGNCFMYREGKALKKKRNYIVGAFVFICVLGIILICIIESMKKSPDMKTLGQNIILSILCSIVASFVFMYIQRGIEHDENEAINDKLIDIDQKLKLQESLYDSGIKSIRKKSYYDKKDDFWKKILQFTESRLDLTGHSLSHWFNAEYKDVFCEKIKNMLNAEKHVRIVLSYDIGEYDINRVAKALEEKFPYKKLKKVERTVYELIKIRNSVDKKKWKYLEIHVTEKKDVTYLYIRTDSQCFISPYISNSTNKGDTFLLELETGVDYSRCFDEDFEEMIKNLDNIKWI